MLKPVQSMRLLFMHAGLSRKIDYELLAFALIALLAGVAFYWVSRSTGSALFLSLLPPSPEGPVPATFVRWLGWLPTFSHVFAFALLTYLALGRRHLLLACLLWVAVNALFELGQALPADTVRLLPDFLNLHTYFIHGVFDPLDLLACAAGGGAAWVLIRRGESR
jgi:hypothetical protein